MIVYRASSGASLTLDARSPLGAGGEAQVLPVVGDESLAAKMYRDPSFLNGAKLGAMIGNPPDYPDRAGHALIAWPIDLLADSDNRILGFLMPRVKQMRPLIDFYNPPRRQRNCPGFSYFYLHRMARNLATAFKVLHDRGYVVGDVNQLNVLGNDQALVTLVDADSFQVTDGTGRIFRCGVGTLEFTPPELSAKSFGRINRTPEQDRFGLAVLIFQLLMEGVHPFDGLYRGSGDPPPREERIAAGHFPYSSGNGVPYMPLPMALPFDVIDPDLRSLMERCFNDGHTDPSKRPEAGVWKAALRVAESRLVPCSAQPLYHYHGGHLSECPWCERSRMLGGRDPFPPTLPDGLMPIPLPDPLPPAGTDSSRAALPAPLPPVPASVTPRTWPAKPANVFNFGLASMIAGGAAACIWVLFLSEGLAPTWRDWPALAIAPLAVLLGVLGIRSARGRAAAVFSSFIGFCLGLMTLVAAGLSIAAWSGREQGHQPALISPPPGLGLVPPITTHTAVRAPTVPPSEVTLPLLPTNAQAMFKPLTLPPAEELPPTLPTTAPAIVEPLTFAPEALIAPPLPFATESALALSAPKITKAATRMKNFTNTIGMKFTRIEPGEFLMGSPAGEFGRNDAETQHKVKLTKPFFFGTYHVTRGQFAVFAKDAAYRTDAETAGDDKSWQKPGFGQTDDHPVVEVSWNDAQAFCKWLSKKEGRTYRLPTEAEWEYAARAGTRTAYFWGDSPDGGEGFANYRSPTFKKKFTCTSPVGSFKPNPWGLYDVTGNANEWCSDLFGAYGIGDAVDPAGPSPVSTLTLRTLRGGSWNEFPQQCRSAFRRLFLPDARLGDLGFRIALDLSRLHS